MHYICKINFCQRYSQYTYNLFIIKLIFVQQKVSF